MSWYITSNRVPSQNGGTIIYYKISAISSGGSTLSSENSYIVQATTTVLTVSISSPASNSNLIIGNSITFTAIAQGGTAPYTNYIWRSNLDGEIGRGETINVNDLSLGQHKITISVTDSLGKVATGSVNIIISIGENAPIITSIKPDAWGYFIEGVDAHVNIYAVVSDPDGNSDIEKVIFKVKGNNYVDSNSADGWGIMINVGGLADGDILTVTAQDKEGHKSAEKTLLAKSVKIPWLLNPFIESHLENNKLFYSFSGDFDLSEGLGGGWSSTTPDYIPIFGGHEHTINPPQVNVAGVWSTDGHGEISALMSMDMEFSGAKGKWKPSEAGVFKDITKEMMTRLSSGEYSYCSKYPGLCMKKSRYMLNGEIEVGGAGEVVIKKEVLTPEQIRAFLNVNFEMEIPTPYSLEIPWVGNQGVVVVIAPHGKFEAIYEFPENSMTLIKRTIQLGVSGGGKFKLGEEGGTFVPVYVEVYVVGDLNIIIIYAAPEYINEVNACLSAEAGAKVRGGWDWYGYSWEGKIGPYTSPEGCISGLSSKSSSSSAMFTAPGMPLDKPAQTLTGWKWEMMHPAPNPPSKGALGIAAIGSTAISKPDNAIIYDNMPDDFPAVAAENNGTALAVWVHGTDISVMPPKMSLYYSNLNGSWSDPAPIHTDNTTVLNPQATYYGNGAVAVWTGDKGTLDINNSFDAWLSTLEIYYSFWDGSSWTAPGMITNDTEGDGQPSIATDGTNITAVWVHDSDSNISTKNDLDIHYSIWNGTNWSSPSALTSDNLQDYGPKVAQHQNSSALSVWTRDTDGNSSTDEDKEIFYSFWNGSWTLPAPLTENEWKDSKPYPVFKGDTPSVIWVQAKNVTVNTSFFNETSNMTEYIDINISKDLVMFSEFRNNLWTTPQNISTEDFSISDTVLSEDVNGNLIAAWRGYNNGSDDIKYTVRDAASKIWSMQKKLVNDSMVNWKLSMDASTNRSFFVWLKHNSTIVSDSSGMRLENTYDDVYYSVLDIKPDLAISADDIKFSSDFRINDTIHVNFTVINEGVLGSGSFMIKAYNGTPVDETQIATIRSDPIVAGGSSNFSINYNVSNFTSSIHILLDTSNEVAELNELNNAASREIKVLPDFAISPYDLSIISNGTGEYKLDLGIRNIGGINATNVPLKIYDDYPPNGTLLYSGSHDVSTDGTHVVISLNITNGTHFLYAIINPENSIAEIDMTNNEAGYYLKMLPDLIISTPRVGFNSNGTATINVTVRNIGLSNASNISVVLFDDTSSLTTFNNETILHTWEINNLEPNEHRSISASIDLAGINKVLLVADINNTIAEIDEFNNMASGNIIFSPVISSFSPNQGLSNIAGESRTFNITVNQIVNITWLINGTSVQTDTSVTSASYTNTSASPGIWNVSAIAQNSNGTAMQTWTWNVATTILPSQRFINGTVMDSVNKTGIAGVKVSANISISTTTSASGFYSLSVTSDTYDIMATFEPTYYANTTTISTELNEVVVKDIELVKKPTGTITGSVTK